MTIRSIRRYIADKVELYAYPPLNRLAGKAVNEILDVASISSRSQLIDWASRKLDAVKRHLLFFSEVEKMVREAKFDNVEEARAAVKALKGCLEKRKDNHCFTGTFPVFVETSREPFAEQTAYIYFQVFLGKVGKGNLFTNIDSSPAATKLFQRALWEGIITKRINGSYQSTWCVFKDPLSELKLKVERLPVRLQILFGYI